MMDPIVILAIRCAAEDPTGTRLSELVNFEVPRAAKNEGNFEEALKALEKDAAVRLSDLLTDISEEYLDVGFQNGFRLGVRLMLECLSK